MLKSPFAPRRSGLSHVLVALACALALGCSGSTETPAHYDGSAGGADGSDGPSTPPCNHGAQKTCSVTTILASGVKSCWQGTQTCENGVWGACQDLPEPAPGAAGADNGAATP